MLRPRHDDDDLRHRVSDIEAVMVTLRADQREMRNVQETHSERLDSGDVRMDDLDNVFKERYLKMERRLEDVARSVQFSCQNVQWVAVGFGFVVTFVFFKIVLF